MKLLLGECWSGPEAADTYNRAGKSKKCVTKGVNVPCNLNDNVECVGKQNTNFVYYITPKGNSVCKIIMVDAPRGVSIQFFPRFFSFDW